MNYSKEEQKIGTWIDGRPVYQKVFDTFTLTTDENYDYISITTAEINPINAIGYCDLIDIDGRKWRVWIPTVDAGFGYLSNIQKDTGNEIYITTNTLKYRNGVPISSIASICIVLQYTKTTD